MPRRLATVLISLAAIVLLLSPDVRSFLAELYRILENKDQAEIAAATRELGWWGPAFIIAAMVLQMFLVIVPSPLLMLVAVLVYGPVSGTLLAISAVVVASAIGYLLANTLGHGPIKSFIGHEQEARLKKLLDQYGFWAVFVSRLIPFLSNDAISFAAGLLGMGFIKYLVATITGIVPLAVAIAFLDVAAEGSPAKWIWSLVIFLVVAGLYAFVKRRGAGNRMADL